ncbi:MAG TPA: hypothetical protein VLM38_13625 [Blastocatellia bacterium]|nr:hypothetical protein [Blastocatellia bacterium]
MQNRKFFGVRASALAFLLICATTSPNSRLALAQRDAGGLDVRVSVADDSYKALKEVPVMVSVIKDGAVLKQMEVHVNSGANFSLPAALYDVRLEGDGMQTLVKRGIHVNDGERTNIIGGPMRVGVGVKTVEYATGGLSREEIAARLAKLEAAVADLQKARPAR